MAQQRIPLITPLDPNQPVQSFLELRMAIITARLATIQSHIQEKNNDLEGVMTQISRLQMQGDKIERKMGTKKKDYKNLIQVYKQGLTIVQALLRQAVI
jgi:regulator of replication initiation timing|tara:strand:- start:210 stop:506 length:297 start_codon:yes stop_codon:yes gene_type:complete